MSQQANYMDDVPVKISEKYKPPPQIIVPRSVSESIVSAKHLVDSLDYDFSLETNILSKLEEIRSLRESQENERKRRLEVIAEEKQRKVDAIAAAEAEEKLKQLSVSEVSYPSTDDSSEISPDESVDRDTDTYPSSHLRHNQTQSDLTITSPLETKENQFDSTQSISTCYPAHDHSFKSNNDQDENILKPTLISSSNYSPANLLDDPDPIKGMQQNTNVHEKYSVLKMVNIKNNFEDLTYSDFEHDTSSPFDNMELKTINDMEMLAQVLNLQQRGTIEYKNNTLIASPAADTTNHVNYHDGYVNYYDVNTSGMDFHPQSINSSQFCNNFETMPNNTSVHNLPSNYGPSNGYLATNTESQNNRSITLANGYYEPMYNYYQNPEHANYAVNQNEVTYPASDYFLNKSENAAADDCSPYFPETSDPYAGYNYSYNTNCSDYSVYIPSQDNTPQIPVNSVPNSETHSNVNSRSRSVPDIIRELDEEIMSARKRMKERSFNASPAPTNVTESNAINSKSTVPVPSCSEQKAIKDNLHRPFQNLPDDLQNLCKYISGMGFPLERVARACHAVGSNDKKVVEYLLTMGELMDLGFTENQVAAALIHNDFNKDKALDDLVS